MKPAYEIKVKQGTYTGRDGQERASWLKIGVVFEQDGRMWGTLDAIPVGGWDGRFSLFEPRERDASAAPAAAPSMPARPQWSGGSQPIGGDDEIPF